MKKFFLLLTKEIRQLLTPQLIIPFVVVVLAFSLLGNVIKKEIAKQSTNVAPVAVLDLDNSALSHSAIENIKSSGINVTDYAGIPESQIPAKLQADKINSGFVIPLGFSQNAKNLQILSVPTYSVVNNFSVFAQKNLATLDASISILNGFVSNSYLVASSNVPAQTLKNPIKQVSYVVAKDKIAQANSSEIVSFVMSQTTFIPIILFLVIVLSAQMIATAVATEKGDKTLETMLSLPVSRKTIVATKMLAAAIVALLMAAVYMYGMRSYMDSVSGGTISTISQNQSVQQVASQLGLTFSTASYAILGLTLFFGILLALAIAMILGLFSEDAQSAQGVITPLMILVIIPYFLTLFLDLNSLSPIYRYLIYAIPFSHIFLVAPNLFLGNYGLITFGIIYEFILFVIFVFIAARIFSSDYIMTMKLNFGKKKSIN